MLQRIINWLKDNVFLTAEEKYIRSAKDLCELERRIKKIYNGK